MKCEAIREHLPDYWMKTLDERGRRDVEAHLAVCPACREDAAMWTRLGAVPDERPSPELRARFEAMLGAYRAGSEHAESATRRKFSLSRWIESWWPYHPALQFSIAAACLLLGLAGGYVLASRGESGQELARLREEVHNTRQLVALSMLEQQSASGRLNGVSWSTRLEKPDTEVLSALLLAAKTDPSVDVRLSAVDALRRYAGLPMVQQGLIAALRGPQSPLVQIALIDLVVETHDREAVDALRKLQSDKTAYEPVRQRAQWAIQQF